MAFNNESIIFVLLLNHVNQGRPSPLRQWCIFPLFQISPLFPKKIVKSTETFSNFTFSQKFFDFHPPKFLMSYFFVIDYKQILNFPPIFAVSVHFLLFRENYYFPYFSKFPPEFVKFMFFTYFMCFSFPPYFDHDAFMHHTMHVLDASDVNHCCK